MNSSGRNSPNVPKVVSARETQWWTGGGESQRSDFVIRCGEAKRCVVPRTGSARQRYLWRGSGIRGRASFEGILERLDDEV